MTHRSFFFILVCVLLISFHFVSLQNSLYNIYNKCNKNIVERLNYECTGYFFEADDYKCIKNYDCDVLAVLQVKENSSNTDFPEMLNFTIYSPASKVDIIQLVIDISYQINHPLNFSYICTKNRNKAVSSIQSPKINKIYNGIGIVEDNILSCTWEFDRNNEQWPINALGEKMNLITKRFEMRFLYNSQTSNILKINLPIFKLRYLYQGCNDKSRKKVCLGETQCASYNCNSLIIIESEESDNLSYPNNSLLKWSFYTFFQPKYDEQYKILLFNNHDIHFGISCSANEIKEFTYFHNGHKIYTNSVITGSKIVVDPFGGMRCFWNTPKKFNVSNKYFDTTQNKYTIQLTSFRMDWEYKIGLPGYNWASDLFNLCNKPLIDRLNQECLGFNPYNIKEDCIKNRNCIVLALFEVETENNYNKYISNNIVLKLYNLNNLNISNISLLIYPEESTREVTKFVCNSYGASMLDKHNRVVQNGELKEEYGSLECSWEIRALHNTWNIPLIGSILNLILNKKISIRLFYNEQNKFFSSQNVYLPTYMLRYLYKECFKKRNLCFGEENCVEHMNCTHLAHISTEHVRSKTLDVNIYVLYGTERLRFMVLSNSNLPTYLVECEDSRVEEFIIYSNNTIIYPESKVITYSNQVTDYFENFFCCWTQYKKFSINNIDFNILSTENKIYINFYKINEEKTIFLSGISALSSNLNNTNISNSHSFKFSQYQSPSFLLLVILIYFLVY